MVDRTTLFLYSLNGQNINPNSEISINTDGVYDFTITSQDDISVTTRVEIHFKPKISLNIEKDSVVRQYTTNLEAEYHTNYSYEWFVNEVKMNQSSNKIQIVESG